MLQQNIMDRQNTGGLLAQSKSIEAEFKVGDRFYVPLPLEAVLGYIK